MKLYAKATSERASKGQGGNQRLDVDITRENGSRAVAVFCQMFDQPDDHHALCVIVVEGKEIHRSYIQLIPKIKGNKQKDEVRQCYCETRGLSIPHPVVNGKH